MPLPKQKETVTVQDVELIWVEGTARRYVLQPGDTMTHQFNKTHIVLKGGPTIMIPHANLIATLISQPYELDKEAVGSALPSNVVDIVNGVKKGRNGV